MNLQLKNLIEGCWDVTSLNRNGILGREDLLPVVTQSQFEKYVVEFQISMKFR